MWLATTGALASPLKAQQAAQSTLSGSASIEVQNPGFEGDFKAVAPFSDAPGKKAIITGQIAEGWGDNSDWAEVNVDYSRDTANPHRGASAQKIAIKSVTAGAIQFVQKATFRKGRVHVWRVWLRGQAGTGLTLMMRQASAPYSEYASQSVSLAAEWQEFRVFGVIPEDTDGFLMLRTTAPMTFSIDDSTLEDLTSATDVWGNLIVTRANTITATPEPKYFVR